MSVIEELCEAGGPFVSIRYDKLFALLKERGHTATYWLRQQGLHAATVSKLRKHERVNTDTIERLCAVLKCQPGDIMEYVDDNEDAMDYAERNIK